MDSSGEGISMSINHVTISGNLVKDAEIKRTSSGMAIVSFTVAVNDRRKNSQSGEWENYANFVDVTWFGTYAEKCAATLTKGSKVCVAGKLRQSRWTTNDGQNRSKLEVIAEEVETPPRPQGQFNPLQQEDQPSLYGSDIPF